MNLLAHLSLLAMCTLARGGGNSINARDPTGANTTTNGTVITPDLSAYVETTLEQNNIPGIVIGFVRVNNGSVTTEFGAWGNMTEEGTPVVPETLFAVGSCSKSFLAASVGILMDDYAQGRNVTPLPSGIGSFTWETKIQALFPSSEWALSDSYATAKLNVRDALGHVSGLPRHDLSYNVNDTKLDMIERLRFLRPYYELRQQWSYNNQMYILCAQIVETYSGKSLADFVGEKILTPLNMTASTYSGSQAASTGLMSQAWSLGGRRIPYIFADDHVASNVAGPGGLISNAIDMAKWLAMLVNGGVDPSTNNTIIPSSVLSTITTSYMVESGIPIGPGVSIMGYGAGWQRMSVQGHDVVNHDGGIPGFASQAWFLPSDNIAIFNAMNVQSPASYDVALRVTEDSLSVPRTDPFNSLFADPPPTSSPPCDVNITIDAALFEATYTNPGYGNFSLCSANSSASACAPVLAALAAVSPNGTLDATSLYGTWARDRVWAKEMLLQRAEGVPCSTSIPAEGEEIIQFSLTAVTAYPQGFGDNQTPFLYAEVAPPDLPVECVVRANGTEVVGCGMMNIGELDDVWMSRTGSVKERADAWFDKV